MATTLDQYREAKNSYLKLRNQAKKELVSRFNELATEMLQVQRELLEDFGEKVAMPAKGKKLRPVKKAPPVDKEPEPSPAAPSAKVIALTKQLEGQKKKLADARAANKPTRPIEDRIYEIEDAIKLAQEG